MTAPHSNPDAAADIEGAITMAIGLEQVKELRERTGLGFSDCKRALEEAGGDMDKAIRLLKEKGAITAAKKGGRDLKEGLIGYAHSADMKKAVLLETLCETDFVAKNESFVKFADDVANVALNAPKIPETVDELLDLASGSQTIKDDLTQSIQRIGENMQFGGVYGLSVNAPGIVGAYIHFNRLIAVIMELFVESEKGAKNEALKKLANDLGMHITSDCPVATTRDQIDAAILTEQKEIFEKQVSETGKTGDMAAKIVEGKLNKWLKESCLMEQDYFTGDKGSIKDMVDGVAKEIGEKITIGKFYRIQIGG